MQLEHREGFDFVFDPEACESCSGRCCRGSSGYVWLDQGEIRAIAAFLHLNTIDFIERYLRREHNRLSLRETEADGEFFCIFFEPGSNSCRIYHHRPAQCRRFPFWPGFRDAPDLAARECAGVRMVDDSGGSA